MKNALSSFVGFVRLVILYGLASHVATACLCVERDVADEARIAGAVFSGTVVGAIPFGRSRAFTYAFKIHTIWKGETRDTIEVAAGFEGECSRWFTVGESYLVYAREYSPGLFASYTTCDRTKSLNVAGNDLRDLQALEQIETFKSEITLGYGVGNSLAGSVDLSFGIASHIAVGAAVVFSPTSIRDETEVAGGSHQGEVEFTGVALSYRYSPLYVVPSVAAAIGLGAGISRLSSTEPVALLMVTLDWPITDRLGAILGVREIIGLTERNERFRGFVTGGVRWLVW
jgi:hypothetical protein